jgi:iron complex outermembrane recepter protein
MLVSGAEYHPLLFLILAPKKLGNSCQLFVRHCQFYSLFVRYCLQVEACLYKNKMLTTHYYKNEREERLMRACQFTKNTLCAALSLVVAGATQTYAEDIFSLEEIVVTAQKREQSLQDVGIAITAFDGETMEAMGVVNSNEIAAKTPNLNIMSPAGEGGVVSVFIRGIGLNDFALNNTGPVGFYVDDSSIGSSNGQLTTLFDIARVEVLKGPQGTLFGRNTTGGALNIVSNKPTDEFEASVKLTAGNYGYLKTEGMVSGSLTDTVNARLALVNYESDGYMENLSTGDKVEKQNFAGRALFDITPSDGLSVLVNIHGSRNDSDSDFYGKVSDSDFYEGTYGDKEYTINVDTLGGSVKAEYDINDALSLTSITSYDDLNKRHDEEGDMSPAELVEFEYNVDTHTFAQELRLNGEADGMHWVAGLYYLAETTNWNATTSSDDLPFFGPLTLGTTEGTGHQELTTKAVFGQVEYELTEDWVLTVGGRYTQLDVDVDISGNVPVFEHPLIPFASSIDYSNDLTNEEFSGKLALNYFANTDVMYYGSITRGFKGGGFNGSTGVDFANYPATAEYDPEILTAYELGLKSTLLDGTMRLNAALFYYDYEDAQVFNSIADPATGLPRNSIENAKSLELYGVDIDLTWQPLEALFIQAGIGYTHSEFDKFDLTVPQVGGTASADLSGETPQNTPEWSATLLANYTWTLGDNGLLMAQVDGSYQSEVFYTNGYVTTAGDPSSYDRNEDVGQGSYSLWNARLSWFDASEQLEVALWGKNLSDKEYASYMFELTDVAGSDQVMRGTPRTYGIDVKYNF